MSEEVLDGLLRHLADILRSGPLHEDPVIGPVHRLGGLALGIPGQSVLPFALLFDGNLDNLFLFRDSLHKFLCIVFLSLL